MEERIEKIEKELSEIRERNVRVEAEKAWERSSLRVVAIAVIIYSVSCFMLFVLKADRIFLAGLLPAIGYFLSMQSLSFIKKAWMQNHK
ncbi:MAG: hypothetical protein V4449_02215 [Patescibacteria group bacterium]